MLLRLFQNVFFITMSFVRLQIAFHLSSNIRKQVLNELPLTMIVMTLSFTFIDRLGSSVEYKYLPASTFLYCSFFINGLGYLLLCLWLMSAVTETLQYLLWLICITVLLLFQLFRHKHTSCLQDVWWGGMWIKNWKDLEGSSHELFQVLSWIGLKELRKTMIIYESVQIWTVNIYITIVSVRLWTNSSGDTVHILSCHFR